MAENVKERPILFSAPMVLAILDGTKTQTRRIVKPQPSSGAYVSREHIGISESDSVGALLFDGRRVLCPYGQPGDRLWVRETWSHTGQGVWTINDARTAYGGSPIYRADGELPGVSWWPSIHMPREFSRITLEVTGVRVERLQDISEEDAIAEGIEEVTNQVSPGDAEFRFWKRYRDGGLTGYTDNPIASYASLWTEINGAGSWEKNPWVWVIEFKRVSP